MSHALMTTHVIVYLCNLTLHGALPNVKSNHTGVSTAQTASNARLLTVLTANSCWGKYKISTDAVRSNNNCVWIGTENARESHDHDRDFMASSSSVLVEVV